jgi:hypothetical protein
LSFNEDFEILAATTSGAHWISTNGAELAKLHVPGGVIGAPALADLEDDNSFEVILANAEELFVATANLSSLSSFCRLPSAFFMAIGDINKFVRDNRKEIVVAVENQLRAFNLNGTLTQEFPLRLSTGTNAKAKHALAPILVDADGDGTQDVLLPGVDGNVYAFNGRGALIPGFPLAMSGPGLGSLAAEDLNNDLANELVGVSGNGYVHVWKLPDSKDTPMWRMLYHDAMHTNRNPVGETPIGVEFTSLMPSNLVYNYPNPTEGKSTRIRYYLSNAARVRIAIFDTAGDLVAELDGPGLGSADNEVEWNLDGIQSGVYLAKVEAEGESQRAVKIIKIAVMK